MNVKQKVIERNISGERSSQITQLSLICVQPRALIERVKFGADRTLYGISMAKNHIFFQAAKDTPFNENVSGYVCNHGSPSGERDTASPRGRYGERPQRDSV